jgi:hypothetical protein
VKNDDDVEKNDDDVEEIPVTEVPTSKGKKGTSKRGKTFNREEDILICSSWFNESKDVVIGMLLPNNAFALNVMIIVTSSWNLLSFFYLLINPVKASTIGFTSTSWKIHTTMAVGPKIQFN